MLFKSIMAGICISIGAILFINLNGGILGALLFSIGLLAILQLKYKLYTGAIGFVRTPKDIVTCGAILIANAIGCLLMFAFPSEYAKELVMTKLAIPFYLIFIKATICGFLIYIAVTAQEKYITILSVMAFILAGAEHSIADICFFISARHFSFDGFIFIIIVILGNAFGAILTNISKGEN